MNRSRHLLWIALAAVACGDHSSGVAGPAQFLPWEAEAWTQPIPSWGSPVRLNLPVPLSDIVLNASGGFGAFGAHQGGHPEGLNHIWIPTRPGTVVRSWADGRVTKIEDMGVRGEGNAHHEYFITIDYGSGLVGKHMDVDVPLVTVGQTVREGDQVARGPSAEIMLIDYNRNDGERTGASSGSPVSPFDYLRDDVKSALIARYVAEVAGPYYEHGLPIGNGRPWEPYLTNPMLFHHDHRGTVAGEWILVNKGWSTPDPTYFDVMTIFDVTNRYGHFQRADMGDQNWSLPGSKRLASATWQSTGGAGTIVFALTGGPTWYGLFAVDESGSRAKLTMEWQSGSYPAAITPNAAVYMERGPIHLFGDAQALGIVW